MKTSPNAVLNSICSTNTNLLLSNRALIYKEEKTGEGQGLDGSEDSHLWQRFDKLVSSFFGKGVGVYSAPGTIIR